jgi:hypothetical protein
MITYKVTDKAELLRYGHGFDTAPSWTKSVVSKSL